MQAFLDAATKIERTPGPLNREHRARIWKRLAIRDEARAFLMGLGDPDWFETVCAMADVIPETIIATARQHNATGWNCNLDELRYELQRLRWEDATSAEYVCEAQSV